MLYPEIKLGELVTLRQGFALNKKSKHFIAKEGLPLLKISDLFNNTETLFVTKDIPKQFKC
jgi:type I restriction enzyme S subunit